MGKVKTYNDLIVWQKSMQLVTEIYLITKKLPKEESQDSPKDRKGD